MTRHGWLLMGLLLLAGCGKMSGFITETDKTQTQEQVQADKLDTALLSKYLADVAVRQNTSAAPPPTSALINAMLTRALEAQVPADYVQRVRDACPALLATPGTTLVPEQIDAIRAVR